jgi:O-antigen/teichoic acid export membrane protein
VQVAVYNSVKVFLRIFDTMAQVIQMFIMPATSRISARGEWSTLKIIAEKSISFATLGLLPVFFLFLFFPSTLLTLIGEQYADAIIFVQIFSVLALITPLYAVAANILMGLGHAKPLFYLSMQLLVVSVLFYMILIPLLGGLGATIGYVAASLFLTWITARALQGYVPVTLKEVVGRTHDVKQFIRSRLVR